MRVFIKHDQRNDHRWKLLVTENSLPMFNLPQKPFHINHLEQLLSRAIALQQSKAREILLETEAVRFIRDCNLRVTRFSSTRHRVTWQESQINPLSPQETLLGVTFTFVERSHASMFKQAWDTGEGGLIRFKHYTPLKRAA